MKALQDLDPEGVEQRKKKTLAVFKVLKWWFLYMSNSLRINIVYLGS